ncbi:MULTISPECIES: YolD-like family protein [Exiguobacterium]|uniref:YolD-like family protein n=1 Tax=Exiguobacterium sp. s161 TaxID=2751191 RepID=UPI001BE76A1A|nr:YolD-like family protein [Exiguobacterium sp. s161]
MSYEDRGNKKWIPFLMPEHKGLLKRYYQEVHHLKFEDTEGSIDGTIENALNDAIFSGDIVTVTAMNGPLTHRFDAFVEKLDYVQEEVHLVKRNLDVEIVSFKQILSVNLTE